MANRRAAESRQGPRRGAATAALFSTAAGEVATGVVEVPSGSAIVAVDEALPATVDAQVLSATQSAIDQSLRNELLGAYESALRQRYTVSINQSVLAQLMEQKSQ